MYFKSESLRVIFKLRFVFFIFFEGILYNNSCTNPTGHKKEHTTRPSNVPVKSKNPVTKKGILPPPIVFCSEPSGHDEIAPGHE